MTVCSVPECRRSVETVDWCHAHYEQWRRSGGTVHPAGEILDTPQKRIFAKVTPTEFGCWIWNGATDGRRRYGSVQWGDKVRRAHRVMFELTFGPVPDGLVLDHLCRTTLCVNPYHLEPVEQYVNITRGISPSAQNAAKSHCKRGHPLPPYQRGGARVCGECGHLWDRARRQGFRSIDAYVAAVKEPAA